MRTSLLLLALILHRSSDASIINESGDKEADKNVNENQDGWIAEDMPDPRYAPESCGISESGWVCDPDGVLLDTNIGGGPAAADNLNFALWKAANESHCPCLKGDCSVHNAVILVAIVKKIKNPEGLSKFDLLTKFAKDLQERHWKADDTECQQEIIIAMSMETFTITTEVGADILKSGMMTSADVDLVLFASGIENSSKDFYSHISFMVGLYSRYIDHPVLTTSTLSLTANGNVTDVETSLESSSGETPPSSITIVLVVLAVAILIIIAAGGVVLSLCKKNSKNCMNK